MSKLYNDNGTVKTTNTTASYRGEYSSVSSNIKTNAVFGGIGRVKYPNEIRLDAENLEALDAYNFTLYKRIGMYIMIYFLELNGIRIDATNEDVYQLGMAVADGSADNDDVLNWIYQHKK